MRTHQAAVLLVASMFNMAPAATAQGTVSRMSERFVDPQNGLSLDDAVRQALEREPTLRSARADVEVAQGKRLQATLRPNPTVSAEYSQQPTATDNQTTAQVQWPLDLFRRSSRVAVADRTIEVTERALDDRARQLTANVRGRYGAAAVAIRDLALAEQAIALMSAEFELVRQRAAEGAVPTLERDQLEVELRRFEADRLQALGRAEASIFELKRVIGMPIDAPVRLRDQLDTLTPPPLPDTTPVNVRDAGADPVRERADVRMADAEVSLAQARVTDAVAQARFDVSLFGGYMRMDSRYPQSGVNSAGQLEPVQGVFHYVSAGATITLPTRNRNQGEISAARAEQASAQARLEAAQLAARADIAAAEARDTATRRALAVAASTVALAARNLDVVRQAYELGRTTVSDVLLEQRRYLDVERANTETMKTAYDAHVALMLARGDR